MKNSIILIFWDKNGVLQDYQKSYFTALLPYFHKVFCVVNGDIDKDGISWLTERKVEIYKRPNKGLLYGAWKEFILYKGVEYFKQFDYLFFSNFTFYGPLFKLDTLFKFIYNSKADIYGISAHPERKDLLLKPGNLDSSLYEHIQCYFFAFNNRLIKSQSFAEYWKSLIPAANYWDEVVEHEVRMTKFFVDRSFSYDTFVPNDKYFYTGTNSNIFEMHRQITCDSNPFLKRRTFFLNPEEYEKNGGISTPSKCFRYILNSHHKIQSDILKDLTSNYNLTLISKNCNFLFSIPKDLDPSSKNGFTIFIKKTRKIALIELLINILTQEFQLFKFKIVTSSSFLPESIQKRINTYSNLIFVSFPESHFLQCEPLGFFVLDFDEITDNTIKARDSLVNDLENILSALSSSSPVSGLIRDNVALIFSLASFQDQYQWNNLVNINSINLDGNNSSLITLSRSCFFVKANKYLTDFFESYHFDLSPFKFISYSYSCGFIPIVVGNHQALENIINNILFIPQMSQNSTSKFKDVLKYLRGILTKGILFLKCKIKF